MTMLAATREPNINARGTMQPEPPRGDDDAGLPVIAAIPSCSVPIFLGAGSPRRESSSKNAVLAASLVTGGVNLRSLFHRPDGLKEHRTGSSQMAGPPLNILVLTCSMVITSAGFDESLPDGFRPLL